MCLFTKNKQRLFNKFGTNGAAWTLVCFFSFGVRWAAFLRLHAVAANAGIPISCDIFDTTSTGDAPPPKPNLKIMDINLNGVIYSVFLGQHYMKCNKTPGGKITATSSASAFYPMPIGPLYASSKAGVSQAQISLQASARSDKNRYPLWYDAWLRD